MLTSIDSTALADLLGQFIRVTPGFRWKPRLMKYWMSKRDKNAKRIRLLPGGGKVLCDLSIPYEAMVWLRQEEETDLEIVRRLLKPGQSFVDCGANIGIWTLVAASAVGTNGKVFAFEPNPATFEKLSQNVSLLELASHIQLFASAVGSTNTNLPFSCEKSHNISQIVEMLNNESILVSVVSLDLALRDNKIDGIKIDVEGFELEVLQGAKSIINNCKPWLCVEFNTLLAKVNTLRDWNVHQHLSELGYVCRHFKDALNPSDTNILPDNWQTSGYCNLYYTAQ